MTSAGSGPDARRQRIFRVVTLLLPLLLLVLLELALRGIGFGGSYPLFVPAPDMPGHLQANPELIRRYYVEAPELAIDPIPFRREKAAGSHRVVVQGASSAAGFPYGRWAGLAGMLGDRLEATFPDREIEVISTALAAVNSHVLLDLADEIIAIEPDAVLIYAGHNEYVGILGVGSGLAAASSPSFVRARIRLARLRVVQLAGWMISAGRSLLGAAQGGADDERGTLIARAAASALVPYGSDAYRRGIEQLEANLAALLSRYREAGIPVYVATLASNERGQRPFAGGPTDAVHADDWTEALSVLEASIATADVAGGRAAFERLRVLDERAAEAWYALARLELAAGRDDAAREAFQAAADRDRLRFRAPRAFDSVVRALAAEHGATLVDARERLASASPRGIIGDELMLEHVHPNAEGYFLLADAFYQALRSNGAIGDWSGAASIEHARRDMPITEVDRIRAGYAVGELESDFPFRDEKVPFALPAPSDEVEALAQAYERDEIGWLETMERLMQIHRQAGRIEEAAVVARIAAQALPALRATNYSAGMLLAETGQTRRARKYLRRALQAEPNDAATLAALARSSRALADEEAARTYLNRLAAVAPRHPLLRSSRPAPAPGPDARD